MKIIYLLSIVLVSNFLTACYKEENIVADIAIPTDKGFYPVSANTFTDLVNGGTVGANPYNPNTNIRFELQYWSESSIKEINFYKTINNVKQKISNVPYSPAYSKIKSCDTLLLDYTMPSTSATTVKLDIEIINQNTLSLTRTLTVKTN